LLLIVFAHDEELEQAHSAAVPKGLGRTVLPGMDFYLREGCPHSTCRISMQLMKGGEEKN